MTVSKPKPAPDKKAMVRKRAIHGRWVAAVLTLVILVGFTSWQITMRTQDSDVGSSPEPRTTVEDAVTSTLGSVDSEDSSVETAKESKGQKVAASHETGDGRVGASVEPSSVPVAEPDARELAEAPNAGSEDKKKEEAVLLNKKINSNGKMDINIVDLSEIEGEASGVGEIAGPALKIRIKVKNLGSSALDLSRATTLLFSGFDMRPGNALEKSGSAPFPENLGAGESATGTFVFTAPGSWKSQVTVQFIADSTANILVFEGRPRLEGSKQ